MKLGFELRSVSKQYDGLQVLTDVSFCIEPGKSLRNHRAIRLRKIDHASAPDRF